MEAGLDRRLEVIDLVPVPTGQDDDVPRLLGEQTRQEVRAGVDLQLPRGGVVTALVEAGDAAQVGDQVRAERGVDVHAAGHAGIRLLLHQGGVEVAGVEGD